MAFEPQFQVSGVQVGSTSLSSIIPWTAKLLLGKGCSIRLAVLGCFQSFQSPEQKLSLVDSTASSPRFRLGTGSWSQVSRSEAKSKNPAIHEHVAQPRYFLDPLRAVKSGEPLPIPSSNW